MALFHRIRLGWLEVMGLTSRCCQGGQDPDSTGFLLSSCPAGCLSLPIWGTPWEEPGRVTMHACEQSQSWEDHVSSGMPRSRSRGASQRDPRAHGCQSIGIHGGDPQTHPHCGGRGRPGVSACLVTSHCLAVVYRNTVNFQNCGNHWQCTQPRFAPSSGAN